MANTIIRRRGHANSTIQTKVVVDQAVIDAAVDVAVDAALVDFRGFVVFELHPMAVVASDVGVIRAFQRTPWRWEARKLNTVLIHATLRG